MDQYDRPDVIGWGRKRDRIRNKYGQHDAKTMHRRRPRITQAGSRQVGISIFIYRTVLPSMVRGGLYAILEEWVCNLLIPVLRRKAML